MKQSLLYLVRFKQNQPDFPLIKLKDHENKNYHFFTFLIFDIIIKHFFYTGFIRLR